MTSHEETGRQAAELEQQAVRAQQAGDDDTAADLFDRAQQARFAEGGE